jgi:hypothetical protein
MQLRGRSPGFRLMLGPAMNFRARPHASSFAVIALSLSACQLFSREPPSSAKQDPPLISEVTLAAPPVDSAPPADPVDPGSRPHQEPRAVEPGVVQGGGPTRGTLSKTAVSAGLSQGMPAFEACYAGELAAQPNLGGTILINFVIAPDGTVPYAAALDHGTDLASDRVIRCVLEALQNLNFESPRGGRAVVTYPLHFAPKDVRAPRAEPPAP